MRWFPDAVVQALFVCALGLAAPSTRAQQSADDESDHSAIESVTLREIPQWQRANAAGPLAPANGLIGSGSSQSTSQVELRADASAEGATARLVWTGSWIQNSAAAPARSGVLDEADLEDAIGDWHFVGGKKVLSWDVGYGFRPGDVVQRENRRALYEYALVGIPVLASEYIDAENALMFVLANPGSGMAGSDPALEPHDESVAARLYRRLVDTDLYGVARLSRRDGLQTGGSLSRVANEQLEWHASVLLQQRHSIALAGNGLAAPAAGVPPATVSNVRKGSATLALAGINWSSPEGTGLIVEGWYDGTSYTKGDWTRMSALQKLEDRQWTTPALRAGAIEGLAMDAFYDERVNILRANLLIHASRKIDSYTPAIDVLSTPADGGVVLSASCAHEGNRITWDSAIRFLTGRSASVYRHAPETVVWYLGVSWHLG